MLLKIAYEEINSGFYGYLIEGLCFFTIRKLLVQQTNETHNHEI